MDSRSAVIYDLGAWRHQRNSRLRARDGERRRFFWSWPATGQVLAVDFPLSTAKPTVETARIR